MTCGYGRTIGAPPQRSRSVKAALLAVPVIVVMLAGCTSTKSAEAPPAVATAAPTEEVERPIRDAQLTPGTRYRFADVLPGLVDVELTAPDPPLYNASDPTVTYLSPDAALLADALVIMAPWAMRVARDHYFSPADIATPEDEFEVTTRPPLDALLDYLSQCRSSRSRQPSDR